MFQYEIGIDQVKTGVLQRLTPAVFQNNGFVEFFILEDNRIDISTDDPTHLAFQDPLRVFCGGSGAEVQHFGILGQAILDPIIKGDGAIIFQERLKNLPLLA